MFAVQFGRPFRGKTEKKKKDLHIVYTANAAAATLSLVYTHNASTLWRCFAALGGEKNGSVFV